MSWIHSHCAHCGKMVEWYMEHCSQECEYYESEGYKERVKETRMRLKIEEELRMKTHNKTKTGVKKNKNGK